MLNVLKYDKPIIVNDVVYPNSEAAYAALKDFTGKIEIQLLPAPINTAGTTSGRLDASKENKAAAPSSEAKKVYRIEVRQYMTKKATPDFDFMKKYNNDEPMPLRVMYGEILQETPGMYKMKLHGRAEKNSVNCLHCMRELTHPVSRAYGIGPICGEHYWQSNDWIDGLIEDEEALFKAADERLRKVTWEGWVIKKAVMAMREVTK